MSVPQLLLSLGGHANSAPVITSATSFSVAENSTAVATLSATDADGDSLTWSITGGADSAKFSITSGGILTFGTAPDYETPTDANTDNVYVVQVGVSDGTATTTQTINVTVTDVAELTFDTVVKSSAVTYSNGNKTATKNGTTGEATEVTTALPDRPTYFEWDVSNFTVGGLNVDGLGLTDRSGNSSGTDPAASGANSLLLMPFYNGGDAYQNGARLTSISGFPDGGIASPGDRMAFAITKTQLFVRRVTGNKRWMGADNKVPEQGIGGLNHNISGSPLYAVLRAYDANAVAKLYTKAAEVTGTIPYGFHLPDVAIAVPGALDAIPSVPPIAYSLRKVLGYYTGSCIRVRRSSDNAEADIGFTSGGLLDETALLAHVGSGSGFIVTWYNQGSLGSTGNATQATTSAQARIVNSGTIDRLGGTTTVPAAVFSGSQGYLSGNVGIAAYVCSAVVTHPSSLSAANTILRQDNVGAVGGVGTLEWGLRVATSGACQYYNIGRGSNFAETSGFASAGAVETIHGTNVGATIYRNGTSVATGTAFTPDYPTGVRPLSFGQNPSGAERWNGKIAEAIIYGDGINSAARSALQTNQKTYWGTL